MRDPEGIAGRLLRSERDRVPITPFSRTDPFLPIETAYRAQACFYRRRLAAGERLIGFKLGLTSKVKQLALGIDQPVYGHLTSAMVLPFQGPARLNELIKPRIEPELAFVIGRQLDPDAWLPEILDAIDGVMPALEIVDSRYNASFRLVDSVADNAGAARVVFGPTRRAPADLVDLSLVGCVFRHSAGIDTATGGAVMGHPAAALRWLAGALAARGESVQPGQIVLSGGLTGSVPLIRGGTVRAEFDRLGSVAVHAE